MSTTRSVVGLKKVDPRDRPGGSSTLGRVGCLRTESRRRVSAAGSRSLLERTNFVNLRGSGELDEGVEFVLRERMAERAAVDPVAVLLRLDPHHPGREHPRR